MSLPLTRPEGPEPQDFVHSRRAFAGVLFAGYAVAAVSAQAEPIVTSEEGLQTANVLIPTRGRENMPAYVARPAGEGRHGVVIVVSEVFGVHDYIRDVCRRLAKLGYVAVAPAFFFRAGDPAPLEDFAEIRKIVETASNDQVMADVGSTLAWINRQPFADGRRTAITGFCWGGAVVWMACAKYSQIKAGVAWYGRLVRPANDAFLGKEDRDWPVDVAVDLRSPVLGLYAGKDKGIPQSDVEAMRTAIRNARKPSDIIVYPEADHGFHADYRAQYAPAAAEDGWKRMLDWFARAKVTPAAR